MRIKKVELTFSHLVIAWMILHGTIWIYLSYALAWAGRIEVVQELSEKVVEIILGVVIIYCLKALFENVSKNNMWPDKTPKNIDYLEEEGQDEC